MKSILRSLFPTAFWQTLGFCKRIPAYWRLDRSEFLRVQRGIEGLPLFITPELYLVTPESVTAYLNWRMASIECPATFRETRDFLQLADGCDSFFDIGSQMGYLSALFARSRSGPAKLVSIEPDIQVQDVLERTRQLNSQPGIEWLICKDAVGGVDGSFEMPISNYIYESRQYRPQKSEYVTVQSLMLASLIKRVGWSPDLIKIDVESYEYEILTSSFDLLEACKPAIHLEVHWEMLRGRGLDPRDFLEPLTDLGYRGIRRKYRDLPQWLGHGDREIVSRIAMKVA